MKQIAEGVVVDYKGGQLILSAKYKDALELDFKVKAAAVANPVIDDIVAKVQSGAIDPIKGTDIDKQVMLQALSFIKAELNK